MKKIMKSAIMKPRLTKFMLAVGFLLTTIFSYAGNLAYAQNQTFTFQLKNVSIKTVLQTIEKQSEFIFMYRSDLLDTSKKVSVNADKQSVSQILDQILAGTNVAYEINDRQILLKKTTDVESEVTQIPGSAKGSTISGLVTDGDGNPVIGATVQIKGSNTGVITDVNGRYSIKAKVGQILVFSYIGYNQEEREIKSSAAINVKMLESSTNLEDVVIIGYGQQKKESVVSSVNSISSKELQMPTRSLTNNLAGQIAGVLAVQRSGEPGRDDAQFWIRGISSFMGGTDPLVLVDGVPRSMSDIGVDEIETFTVLKDAAATAVYGAEGANGVVLITSKRGKSQKPTLDVRAEFGMNKPTRLPRLMGSYDYARLYNEAAWEDAGNPTKGFVAPYSDEVLEMYRTGADPDLYPDADFLSLLKDQSFNQRVTLNLRGGGERVRYFVSGAFYHEDGIYESRASDLYDANIGLSRYNIRSNIDIDVTKTTLLSVDISGQYTDSHYPGISTESIWGSLFSFAPNEFPLIFSDGTISESKLYNNMQETANPYNKINESGYQDNWEAFIQSKLTLDQKLDFITKGLSLKLSGSFDADYYSQTRRTKEPKSYRLEVVDGVRQYIMVNEGKPNLTDPINNGTGGEKRIYLEGSLNYKRVFNDVHDVSGMLLYMQKERQTQGDGLPFKKQSFVSRVSYGYDGRYMLEGSFGMTGSENFAKGHRWGIFPAFGAAWYISNEAFMQSCSDVLNKLKLRASYGLTGNDDIGSTRFPYRGSLSDSAPGYNFGFSDGPNGGVSNGYGGIIEELFESPFLSWEIEEKKNIGLDLGLLDGRIDMSVDYFHNNRRNILMQRNTVSGVAGFRQNPWQNYGKVRNSGVDGNIVFRQNIRDWVLSFRGNFTYAHNKIIEYDEVAPLYDYQRYTGNILGKPQLYIADGLYAEDDFDIVVDPTTGSKQYTLKEGMPVPSGDVRPGDIKYRDLNGDKKIDSYDATYDHDFYSENPEIVYGFGLNVEYKGIYAGVFFQGVANAAINLNGSTHFIPFNQGKLGSVRCEAMNHWSSNDPTNTNVMFPRLHTENFVHNTYNSTWWYRDASFLRLKNLEVGYNFDKEWLKKCLMKQARIYIQGNNLAVWDHVKMWDPELGSAGAGIKYPINMTWTVGLELTF